MTALWVAVGFAALAIVAASILIKTNTGTDDLEIVRIRFAQVTFGGILTLFIFSSIVYVGLADKPADAAKDIFEKAVTGMTPLAGVIVGYLFGSRQSTVPENRAEGTARPAPTTGQLFRTRRAV